MKRLSLYHLSTNEALRSQSKHCGNHSILQAQIGSFNLIMFSLKIVKLNFSWWSYFFFFLLFVNLKFFSNFSFFDRIDLPAIDLEVTQEDHHSISTTITSATTTTMMLMVMMVMKKMKIAMVWIIILIRNRYSINDYFHLRNHSISDPM